MKVTSVSSVYLYHTVHYFDARQTAGQLFIRDAVVSLSFPTGNVSFSPDSVYDFVKCDYEYFYKGSQTILPKTAYMLEIRYGGESFTAMATTDQRKAIIDSTGYILNFQDVYGGHEGVVIHFK